eukprot:7311468-Pyramimonas_sp.AAC.1
MIHEVGRARRAERVPPGVSRRIARREIEGAASGTILTLHQAAGHWRVALVHHGARRAYHWDPFGHPLEAAVVSALKE